MQLIDWNLVWNNELLLTERKRLDDGAFWDQLANGKSNKAFNAQLTKAQLAVIQPCAGDSVIEIGSGAGRLTRVLAKKTAAVTAVDASEKMVMYLKRSLKQERIKNVRCITSSWQDAASGGQLDKHDLIVASYCLFMMDMRRQLEYMHQLARKKVCLFVPAELRLPKPVQQLLHGANVGCQMPDHIILLNLLYSMGVCAQLNILPFQSKKKYNTLEEATESYQHYYNAPQSALPNLQKYIKKIAKPTQSGNYLIERTILCGAITWSP